MAYPEPEQRRANPITQHPAFPAVVALWFAALLGLGSLVLPAVLLERLVEMSGLASLVPAASPPLGFTARVLVALVAGAAGGALGLMLARRVAEASGVPRLPRRVRGAGETRSPLNVLDELGDDRVTNGHAPPLSRRRAALMADGEPTAAILAPPIPADLADDQEPLMLSDLAAQAATPPEAEPEATPAVSTDEEISMTADQPAFLRPHPTLVPTPAAEDDGTSDEMRQVFTGPLSGRHDEAESEPLSDESLDAAPQAAQSDEAQMAPEPALKSVTADAGHEDSPAPWQEQPLEELGLVQLVQRLGSSLERRRAVLAQAAQRPVPMPPAPVEPASEAPAPTPPLAPAIVLPETGVEAAQAEEAALARAAWFGAGPAVPPAAEASPSEPLPPAAIPAAPAAVATPVPGLRPAFLDGLAAAGIEDEEEEPFPDFSLPLRGVAEDRAAAETQSIRESEHEPEHERRGPDGYRSLLAVNGSGGAEKKIARFPVSESAPRPARLFDAPGSRPFGKNSLAQAQEAQPADEASDPAADTDAALRAALATLQRMSGPA